jgi:hypothetical protein
VCERRGAQLALPLTNNWVAVRGLHLAQAQDLLLAAQHQHSWLKILTRVGLMYTHTISGEGCRACLAGGGGVCKRRAAQLVPRQHACFESKTHNLAQTQALLLAPVL